MHHDALCVDRKKDASDVYSRGTTPALPFVTTVQMAAGALLAASVACAA